MAFIGLNVREVDGLGAPAIVGAATSVAGFNVLTRRGVPNAPERIDSFPRFVERFGEFFAGGLGAYLVRGFFDNGGQVAWVNRVISTDPVTGHAAAATTLRDSGNAAVLTLSAGFRGKEDPGTWGDGLHVQVRRSAGSARSRLRETAPAEVAGTVALGATTDMSGLPSIALRVDGETAVTTIAFQAGDFPGGANAATREQIRDAVNARQTKVRASLDGTNHLVLASTRQVAGLAQGWSSVQVTAANAVLGFAAMAQPIQGTPATTTQNSTAIAKVSGFDVGDAVELTDGVNRATVKLLTLNAQTGAITWTPNVANIGTWTTRDIGVAALEIDLIVALGGAESQNVVETWTGLSMERDVANYAPARINDSIRGSRFVIAEDENAPAAGPAHVPAVTAALAPFATKGRDGTPTASHFIGDSAQRTGLFAFDPYAIQLLTCERTDASIVTAALAYCENRGDCMYIGAVPEGYNEAGQAVAYGQQFQNAKVYGALYAPSIVIADPLGMGDNPLKVLPPVGHVMGVYARTEVNRGIWKAPAGDQANLRNVLDVDYRLTDAELTDLVKSGSVNGIRVVPRAGIVVDSSRTLSTDTRWLYVNVRLLFNYVKSSLRQGLRWVRQEPNRDMLWNTIKFNSVVPFLMGLWRQGAFGSGAPEEVFTVICDASNNPPEQVDQGNLNVEIYFYPSKPAETIVITQSLTPSGASVGEA